MKIGITTIYPGNRNYGGMLQAYALVESIRKMGYPYVEQINFEYSANPIYPSLLSRCYQYSIKQILQKLFEMVDVQKNYCIKDKLRNRTVLFDEFRNKYIPQSRLYKINEHLQIGSDYDILITGSDQVWNPNVVRDVFMFDFPTRAKKIAYAASIARKSLSKREKRYMIPRIKDFDHVSVREVTGQKILIDEGISCDVVLDPTMLLTRQDWDRVIAPRIIRDKYVLIYCFSNCEQKHEIKKFYLDKGIRTILIPYAKMQYNAFDGDTGFEKAWDIGPSEFLSLIKYSEHVFTDSFHGTVFSIILHKPFTVFKRTKNAKKVSMNSRLTDLLELLGLNAYLVEEIKQIPPPLVEYDIVDKNLLTLREKSLDWLNNSIKE